MSREEATAFLLDDCVFQQPLSLARAEEVWQAHKTVADALPPAEPPRRLPLSAADLKSARKFRTRHPAETSIVDFANLNPMDLVIHQLWISPAIAERYKDAVAPDKWHRTALLDPPPDAALKWRREENAIVFDLPRFEYLLMGPFTPDGTMRPGTALDFVSVALHAERALLVNGYHRVFAAAQYALRAANAPRAILFGVSNSLDLMGADGNQMRRMLEGPRPPRLSDFFNDELAVPVILRKRRYEMRVQVEVVSVDEEQPEERDGGSSKLAGYMAPAASLLNLNANLEVGWQHFRGGRFDEAAEQYQRALFLKPDSAEINSALGAIFAKQKKMPEAVEHLSRALALKPDYTDAHYNLGAVQIDRGEIDDAILHLRRALVLDAKHADAHQQLGHALTCKGNFGEAMEHCQRAIAIKPDHAEAHFTRAEIKTFRRGDPDLANLEQLAAAQLPAGKRTFIHFALAKALDDTGDYERAFEHLKKGNALKRGQIEYDEIAVMESIDGIARIFEASVFDRYRGLGDKSSLPFFILGMPRSGSTLVEQILASHPQVYAGGELDYMLTAANRIMEDFRRPAGSVNPKDGLNAETLRNGAEFYLDAVRRLSPQKDRIVDKMPGNVFNIGLIRLMLPNAKIIHTVRNPLDTCLSCYAKLFRTTHPYTYDLGELGRYYRRYAGLVEHWRSVLPEGAVLDVVYEDLVNDLEGQSRRLIDYCGLPWDDRCLDFHRTNRTVSTFSNFQVRQPLFRSSMERWRRYESGLGPLLDALGDIVPQRAAHGHA